MNILDNIIPGSEQWYEALLAQVKLNTDSKHETWLTYTINKIQDNIQRYLLAGQLASIPAWLVGAIHGLEANFRFDTYLHNGDPLSDSNGKLIKTTHVPKGVGPFASWEDAAANALLKHFHRPETGWNLPLLLQSAEAYNGLGYLNKYKAGKTNVFSAYLWSGTNIYTGGKYIADGIWSDTAMSAQVGVVSVGLGLNMILEQPPVILETAEGLLREFVVRANKVLETKKA